MPDKTLSPLASLIAGVTQTALAAGHLLKWFPSHRHSAVGVCQICKEQYVVTIGRDAEKGLVTNDQD